MVKTKKTSLGRSLIKDKRQQHGGSRRKEDSWLHTSELQDGCEWGRLNLQSVTEQSTLDDFLTTAELAGKEFTAERLNVKIVTPSTSAGLLTSVEEAALKKLHQDHREFIKVPRRPKWDAQTTPEALQLQEREAFLAWRKQLALMQEKDDQLILTPYEKNLDVWRQLWRVIERSDVVCQIVDARNPLLFKCDDLSAYVSELEGPKENLLIVNKADLLTEKQRSYWVDYFKAHNIEFVFWSALKESQSQDEALGEELAEKLSMDGSDDDTSDDSDSDAEDETSDQGEEEDLASNDEQERSPSCTCGTTDIFDRLALLELFHKYRRSDQKHTTIGLVGYPNVGKSSTVNALMCDKKTAVSATPGKTKHFQTLFPEDETCLCDCPGLVFPNFVSTKADMVINGILPIDQLRDHIPPVSLVCRLIPRHVLEDMYGINIPTPGEGEEYNRDPTADELLSSYASMRGFMTSHGMPDCPRASRYILKDFVKTRLLYCMPPPGASAVDFEPCVAANIVDRNQPTHQHLEVKMHVAKKSTKQVDKDFFKTDHSTAHYNAPAGIRKEAELSEADRLALKPWKKHHNRNKKEKIRRLHKAE